MSLSTATWVGTGVAIERKGFVEQMAVWYVSMTMTVRLRVEFVRAVPMVETPVLLILRSGCMRGDACVHFLDLL